jgi:hypothetical protein
MNDKRMPHYVAMASRVLKHRYDVLTDKQQSVIRLITDNGALQADANREIYDACYKIYEDLGEGRDSQASQDELKQALATRYYHQGRTNSVDPELFAVKLRTQNFVESAMAALKIKQN